MDLKKNPERTQSRFKELTRFVGGLLTAVTSYLVLLGSGIGDEKIIALATVCVLVFQLGVYPPSKGD